MQVDLRNRMRSDSIIRLRKEGLTLKEIAVTLNVSISTIKRVLKESKPDIDPEWLEKVRISGRAATIYAKTEKKWRQVRGAAAAELGEISARDLLFLGIGLFWGEGGRKAGQLEITNSDYNLLRVMVRWVQMMGGGAQELRAQISVHDDVQPQEAVRFWADKLSLKTSQFQKSMVAPSVRGASFGEAATWGVCKLRVRKSALLLNRMLGFIEHIGGEHLPVHHGIDKPEGRGGSRTHLDALTAAETLQAHA